jgi:hypothetical protein
LFQRIGVDKGARYQDRHVVGASLVRSDARRRRSLTADGTVLGSRQNGSKDRGGLG